MDADQKLSRWTNLTTAVSAIVGVVGWIIGLLLNIPWQLGLLSGLVAWFILMNAVVARGRREVRREETTIADQLEELQIRLQEVEQERDEFKVENERLKDQTGEDLKQRALELSNGLFEFAKERDKDDPQSELDEAMKVNATGEDVWEASQAKSKYDAETNARYHQEYEADVRALLNALERQGWCDTEERKDTESTFVSGFMSTPNERIRKGAARLAAFGKRL